jgi:hypothetical protein
MLEFCMVDEEDRKGRGGGGNRYRRAHITSFRASGWVDRSIFVFLLEVGGDRVWRHHGSSISHLLHPVLRDSVPLFSSLQVSLFHLRVA